MIDSRIPISVVRELLQPRGIVDAQIMPPGMSGARVFQCTANDHTPLALKCWPDETKAARVREAHRIMTMAHANGCTIVPTVHPTAARDTLVPADGRYWELSDWVAGCPLAADASLKKIAAGAEAIAKFHESVRDAGTRPQIAPAVKTRLARKESLDRTLPAIFDLDLRFLDSGPLTPAIAEAHRLVRAKWAEVGEPITRCLTFYLQTDVATQYVLRDVHREHVLFTGDEVTGLIDFDALRVDTPATDLARWTGSFLAGHDDESALWQATLAGYRAYSPFSGESEALAKGLIQVNIWCSLANWLVWILAEKRDFAADNEKVAARIGELVQIARRWS